MCIRDSYKIPQHAYLTFEQLGKTYYQKGDFTEVENIYRSILKEHPQDIHTLLALIELLEKKGEIETVLQLCREVIEIKPSIEAYIRLIRYQKDNQKEIDALLNSLADLCKQDKSFTCSVCYYRSTEPLWRCPECGNWRTFGV